MRCDWAIMVEVKEKNHEIKIINDNPIGMHFRCVYIGIINFAQIAPLLAGIVER